MYQRRTFSKTGIILLVGVCGLVIASAESREQAARTHPKRTALVVGNSRYEAAVGPLKNPSNDARAIHRALKSLGFEVMEKRDLTREELSEVILAFRKTIPGSEIALFYYAGHGMAIAGSNYLIPIKSGFDLSHPDAETLKMRAETRLFNAEQLVADLGSAGADCTLIILDACRSVPLLQSAKTRSLVGGGHLLGMTPPSGSLIAFSTDNGRVAFDGQGGNGLYTEALLKNLVTPGLSVEQVFKRTRAEVMAQSGGLQIPAEYSRLVGDDIFLAGTPSGPTQTGLPPAPKPPPGENADSPDRSNASKSGDPQAVFAKLDETQGVNPTEALRVFAELLERVKNDLRDLDSPTPQVVQAEKTCAEILKRLPQFLPVESEDFKRLASKAWNRLGNAQLLLGRPEEALKSFNEALPLSSSDAYIYLNRGRAFLALGNPVAAKADFLAASNPSLDQPKARQLALDALVSLERALGSP